MATVVIFIGVTATVIFAGHTTPNYDLDDLIMLYEQPIMYFYIAAVSTFLVALFVTAKVRAFFHSSLHSSVDQGNRTKRVSKGH